VRSFLECFSRETIKGHWSCPCGSGLRIRDCHPSIQGELKEKLPPHIAKWSLELLAKQK
jgi:hypothetical protein